MNNTENYSSHTPMMQQYLTKKNKQLKLNYNYFNIFVKATYKLQYLSIGYILKIEESSAQL